MLNFGSVSVLRVLNSFAKLDVVQWILVVPGAHRAYPFSPPALLLQVVAATVALKAEAADSDAVRQDLREALTQLARWTDVDGEKVGSYRQALRGCGCNHATARQTR